MQHKVIAFSVASCHGCRQEAVHMCKLRIFDPEIVRSAVQQEILRSWESRYDHRLHGILLITQGLNAYDVTDILGQDPRTIERWVQRFEECGFAGPHEGERDGSGDPSGRSSMAICDGVLEALRTPRISGTANCFPII